MIYTYDINAVTHICDTENLEAANCTTRQILESVFNQQVMYRNGVYKSKFLKPCICAIDLWSFRFLQSDSFDIRIKTFIFPLKSYPFQIIQKENI